MLEYSNKLLAAGVIAQGEQYATRGTPVGRSFRFQDIKEDKEAPPAIARRATVASFQTILYHLYC